MMIFSHRTDWTAETNAISATIARKKASSRSFVDLTESNPTKCSFKYPDETLLKALGKKENLIYTPDSKGLLVARKAISQYYAAKNVTVDPEHIILTSSTSEAYSHIFRLLLNPGETVAAPAPGYPLFDYLGGLNDLTLAKYSSKKMPPEAKALLVVNPNNPTGNFTSAEEKQAMNHFCASGKVSIISDEVFLDYAYAEKGETFAGNEKVLTFTMSGISKILGLPQMKLSWIVVSGPQKIREEALQKLEVIADTYLSVGSPVQNALPGWLAKKDKPVNEILKRVISNRELLKKKIGSKLSLSPAQAGWYAVLYSDAIKDEEKFVLSLLDRQDVLVHPGFFYDFEQTGHLVLSLLLSPEKFEKGVDALMKAF